MTDQSTAEAPAEQLPEEPTEAVATDELRQPLLDALTEELGDAVLGSEIANGDIWVRVDRGSWRRTAEICRDKLRMDYFCFLSGMDWQPAPGLSGERAYEPAEGLEAPEVDNEADDAAAEERDTAIADTAETDEGETSGDDGGGGAPKTGVAGGDTRFQVFARFYSVPRKIGITVKADLDDERPSVESITSVYRGADWHEREIWEMYGFDFEGHPGLRHIYLPSEFEGFPLRKDFPLLAREVKPWPGLVDVEPLPGEPAPAGDAGAEGES